MPTLTRGVVTVESASPLVAPTGMRTLKRSGDSQLRNTAQAGWRWRESYAPINIRRPDELGFLTDLEYWWARTVLFDAVHPRWPGSGEPPLGEGTSGVTVNGGGQTGDSLATTGWPASTTNVVRRGDVIGLGDRNRVFKIRSDADSDANGNATLQIFPPIFTGNAPADLTAVATTGVTFRVFVESQSGLQASLRTVDRLGGVRVTFREKL